MARIYRRHEDELHCVHLDEFAALEATCCWEELDGKVVGYNAATNTLIPIENPGFDGIVTGNLLVCGDTDITQDLRVNGNVTVAGTLTYTNEEIINSTSDNLVLRQNNTCALAAGDYSGIIINNSQGSGVGTSIVTDCDGTVHIGNTAGTETTYTDIYLSKTDGKWYSDDELTTEVTPSGDLTSWTSTDATDDYVHYVNAVFTNYTFSCTQPIATRNTASCMVNTAPVIWNAACTCLETSCTNVPQMAYGTYTDELTGCLCYGWVDVSAKGVVCYYETQACALADRENIPNGALVMIGDQNEYLYGEDR